jgi:similar to stage IV sporulation protein
MDFFTKIWKFFNGYVTVTVEGFFLEKFTNLCAINSIPFWNIVRYGNAKMVGRTTIKGFREMRLQVRKCGCRVRLGKKRGTPFFLNRYKKRKIFVAGFVLFFALIRVAGMFVWNINITGNDNISTKDILFALESIGIKKWVLKDKLEVRELANMFMTKRDDISWVGIDVDGINVNVEVVEKPKVPDRVEKDIPCDIISSKPALIVEMDTYQGKPMVSVGDIVDGGTVLVAGVMEMTQFPEKTEYVHALANIKGKVWYERSRGLKLSNLRDNKELEKFAYNLAYQNIKEIMASDAEILNISKNITYTSEKIIVTVTVECIENIGIERKK